MLDITDDILAGERVALEPLHAEAAELMHPVLSDPRIYEFIAREAPSLGELAARFARISRRTAPDRADQWLNWIVRRRSDGAPVGMVEATVRPDNVVSIAYMLSSAYWRRGYAAEAVRMMIDLLVAAGARGFEAVIDVRNEASRALVAKLGFRKVETRSSDDIIAGAPSVEEVWRREAQSG